MASKDSSTISRTVLQSPIIDRTTTALGLADITYSHSTVLIDRTIATALGSGGGINGLEGLHSDVEWPEKHISPSLLSSVEYNNIYVMYNSGNDNNIVLAVINNEKTTSSCKKIQLLSVEVYC